MEDDFFTETRLVRTLVSKWARRGEAYSVLVATQMAMPQRPVRDPRSARQTCLAYVIFAWVLVVRLRTDCDEVFRIKKGRWALQCGLPPGLGLTPAGPCAQGAGVRTIRVSRDKSSSAPGLQLCTSSLRMH